MDSPAKPTFVPPPAYPSHLARYLLGARVNLVFVVNQRGGVEDVHAVDVTLIDFSYVAPEELKTSEKRREAIAKEFGDAAVAWAKQLRYQPATKSLKPVATRMAFAVAFIARPGAAMPPGVR